MIISCIVGRFCLSIYRLFVICHNWIWPLRSDEETDVLSVKRSCVGFSYFMSWQNSDCISPVRKVSRTMGFEEMCVTRLEQELCTQIFLPFVKLMKYNEIWKIEVFNARFQTIIFIYLELWRAKWMIFYECVLI